MGGDYVQAFYQEEPTAAGTTMVNGPCSLVGVWIVPHTSNDSVATITFENGSGGDVLLRLDIGGIAGANTSNGQQYVEIPGNGVRFDVSLHLVGSDTAADLVESVTGFVVGAKPDAIT